MPVIVIWLTNSVGLELDRLGRIVVASVIGLALATLYRLGQRRFGREDRRRRRW